MGPGHPFARDVDECDIEQATPIAHFTPPTRQVRKQVGQETWVAAWSPDGHYFAWSLGLRKVKLVPWHRQLHRPIEEDDLDHDGQHLDSRVVTIDAGNIIRSLAFGTSSAHTHSHSLKLNWYRYKKFDDLILATGLQNGRIRTWEVKTGALLLELVDHHGIIMDVKFAPDGSLRLVSASKDSTLKVWQLEDDGNMSNTLKASKHPMNACCWAPDSKILCGVGDARIVHLWDMDSYKSLGRLDGHHHSVVSCEFSPDGALLATASYDTTVIIWVNIYIFLSNYFPSRSFGEASVNFARLAHLVLQEGTAQLRMRCMGNIINGLTLSDALANRKRILEGLMKKGTIKKSQFHILYPPTGSEPNLDDIDMTLWLVVARNLTKGRKSIKWNKTPTDADTKWQHEAIRLRNIRNRLFHFSVPELSNAEFAAFWGEAKSTLLRLGSRGDVIDEYLSKDFDPLQTQLSILRVREQVLEELYGSFLNGDHQKKHTAKIIISLVIVAVIISVIGVVTLVKYLKYEPYCSNQVARIHTSRGTARFFDRKSWKAAAAGPNISVQVVVPIRNVVISCSSSVGECENEDACCLHVKGIQHYDMNERKWSDIVYHFLLGHGAIYEGRKWNEMADGFPRWNRKILSIDFIGEFIYESPLPSTLLAAQVLLETLVDYNWLDANYSLYAHCQLNKNFTNSPGKALFDIISNWTHFRDMNTTQCNK